MGIKTIVLIAGIAMWMTAPAWASALNYSFDNCSQITSALGFTGACPGNLETSLATYTSGGIGITAAGYQEGFQTTNTSLYVKNDGGDESGLGIATEGDHEIDATRFIQLNVTNLAQAGITSGTLSIGSVGNGEGYAVYTSNQGGHLGSLELTGALDAQGFAVTWSQSEPILGITATDLEASGCDDCDSSVHSDVLVMSLFVGAPEQPTPEPASLALMGTGLLALALAYRRFQRISLAK